MQALASLDVSKDVIQQRPDSWRTHSAVTGRYSASSAWTLQEDVSSFLVARKSEIIYECLKTHKVTMVCGDTGSGKTTQVPHIAAALVWCERRGD